MAEVRFVPRSIGKVLGTLAVVGVLAGAATLLAWGCTDNSGGANFVKRSADAGADGASDAASATDGAATDGAAKTDGAADHGAEHADGATADAKGDR